MQIENGVGMMRLFWDEAQEEIRNIPEGSMGEGRISLVTAVCAYGYIRRIAEEIACRVPGGDIQVHCIRNDFFGERITVTGLLTGQDIIAQLKGKDLGKLLLLPENLLKADEELLLDDLSVEDLKKSLQTPIDIVKSSGRDFVHKIVNCLKKESK